MSRALMDHIASSFREDAPRPPVPGEEGDAPCYPGKLPVMKPLESPKSVLLGSPGSSARRNEDGLGEPEGSASPDSPLSRWTKSLHSLLGDQDGALLFRTFLEREKCVDTLDFWFACNGFRQMDLKDTKTQRVAKAIYKRYIENNSIVAKQLKPATKTYIRDNIKKQHIDSAMFDQAQTEIQTDMEENAYQMFLTSDIYLEFVRTGGENPSHVNSNGLADLKVVCGYLPTLNEEEEWSCDLKAKALIGLSAKAQRAPISLRAVEVMDGGFRSYKRGDSLNPCHSGSFAPVSSTNDSEVSSDALTDDAMSVTDSSVDGIPPYKLGSKKQLQREMQRNMRMNSQVSLPAFPRTRHPPKEMIPMEPAQFAAQLIARLENLKRQQETMNTLEERLQQIQEEEEREDAEIMGSAPALSPHSLPLLSGSSDEDPQAILDEHLSRVLKTPGCQSPAVIRHSPRSSSPEHRPFTRAGFSVKGLVRTGPSSSSASSPDQGAITLSLGPNRTLVSRQSTKHIHHHYIHHHAGPKSKEQIEREAALRVHSVCSGSSECQPCQPYQRSRSLGREMCGAITTDNSMGRSSSLSRRVCRSGAEDGVAERCMEDCGPLQLPTDTADPTQNVLQWILESKRQGRHKSHSTQSTKKSFGGSSTQTHTWGGGGSCGHLRGHQPAQPFIQDPAMPPLPPPNTLAQLEEACRRLEEVSTKPTKQRHSASSLQREKTHLMPVQDGASVPLPLVSPSPAGVPATSLQSEECKKGSGSHAVSSGETVVTYFFCGEEIPYRRTMKSHSLTLGHFKEQLRKKGNYRYYFKKASDEFECGAVFEEVSDDCSLLPTYEGKILGKVERME
ncbi:axin-2 [Maylandia zebra]|uniref:Axin 2 (conductin, axil) n=3 Tax=Pseudocrenilabrinae TaxID=318546 RepID=A0A3P9B3D7_9CICH|nr:axin-2 [Maylandia zebra]XP_004558380.1 axin-2 [Maylandia zebra]XP_026020835.1 axin-2-like isoform X1 [Astatotilapia calliptera]